MISISIRNIHFCSDTVRLISEQIQLADGCPVADFHSHDTIAERESNMVGSFRKWKGQVYYHLTGAPSCSTLWPCFSISSVKDQICSTLRWMWVIQQKAPSWQHE